MNWKRIWGFWRLVPWSVAVIALAIAAGVGQFALAPDTDCRCFDDWYVCFAFCGMFPILPLALAWPVGWIGGRRTLVPTVVGMTVWMMATYGIMLYELVGHYWPCTSWAGPRPWLDRPPWLWIGTFATAVEIVIQIALAYRAENKS